MKNSTHFRFLKLCILFFTLNLYFASAQNRTDDILDLYQNYTYDAREVVYVHLNKSTFIKGENIGFTAYVLDKKDKKPSQVTTNLYVSIEDENNNVLKQKLLKVENGVATNIIEIDSAFTSGHYHFKAYTNWMRNFNEQNYYVESINVIDPKVSEYIETEVTQNTIDAQFLPEGGHLLSGVVNIVGVILKDSKGYGIPHLDGKVYDQDNNFITEFKVNKLGIGKFPLLAEIGKSYKVNIKYLNKDHTMDFSHAVEPLGVTLSMVQHRNKAIVTLKTNNESQDLVQGKTFQLTIHNGDNIDVVPIIFNDELKVTKAFDLKNLASGVNILTLFNDDNKPVVERLFFNYNGIDIQESNNLTAKKSNDSVVMKLNFKHLDSGAHNNISVSVLPQETVSYNRHHNIISYTYLQPYVRGQVEQAKYYFSDITEEKKAELDNLLITQGWSSYDWNTIFSELPELRYTFEQGITLKGNINAERKEDKNIYMMHAVSNQNPVFAEVEENGKNFTIENVFVAETDSIFISKVKNNADLVPAQLYLQAYPNKIPNLEVSTTILRPKTNYRTTVELNPSSIYFKTANNVQKLDEVVVKTELDKIRTRTRELSHHRYGKVKVLSQLDRLSFYTLAEYLIAQNLTVVESPQDGLIVGGRGTSSGGPNAPSQNGNNGAMGLNPGMAILLDGNLMLDTRMFYRYSLSNIDYIEIDRSGLGMGATGSRGVIKLYTLTTSAYKSVDKSTAQKYKLPLTFSAKKKFYVPRYQYYNDDFFKGYGTVDWKPDLTTDANGNVTLKIAQPEVPITLFIEGIANDGTFIFEEKTISLN
ncbi:hypothetical protein [Winogradskyella sp. MIT101101]|uniref:hypothetical protein n=1 Tax=Winogradskyella sp. MIT101101 TaxID=3098297 RepID=UPI003999CB7F